MLPLFISPLLPSSPPLIPHSQPSSHPLVRACTTAPPPALLPEPGDVVIYAGRWANEDALGLVSTIRYNPSRSTHVVDIVQLRPLGRGLFAVPRATVARRKSTTWMDIKQVRVAKAEYVPAQDAYRVEGTRDGYADLRLVDEGKRDKWSREYEQLKQRLLRESTFVGVVGTVTVWVGGGGMLGRGFGLGVLGGLLYLVMLQRGVDSVGKGGIEERIFGLRFLVPALPFVVLARRGELGKAEVLAVVCGLLCYKVPLLWRTGNEVVDGLAGLEVGKTGMVGTLLGAAARKMKKGKEREESAAKDVVGAKEKEKVLVIAGPSGVGKSTLIHRLMEELPQRFAYSVSHTTREMRDGEANGVDYWFVERAEFRKMAEEGRFVEYATVHGQSYGTSYEAVEEVLRSGKVCILDLDVQGVEVLRKKTGLEWDARFVWIAPPSFRALEDRLRARGTETAETLKRRLDTAMREMAYAASNNVFDLTIINADLESSYKELRNFVNEIISQSQ